jgi:hypothetical protein
MAEREFTVATALVALAFLLVGICLLFLRIKAHKASP